ncbi:MAG: ChbG/HpnK family deacetylase [Gaiellaceae bacterium MAG52_C11]|nr:ChbG/HpnK family deacetylase [Candidatus Gaiellasilicea maunaloa]
MPRLIVNADDLGYTEGINRGILEAHERGIVTSTSLMVDRPAAERGVELARQAPRLSVGLHAVLDHVPPERCEEDLVRQLARFEELVAGRPTHLDSHHHTQREPGLRETFAAFAEREELPMRERSVLHDPRYYGAPAIGVERLLEILGSLQEGETELGCHPGYADGLVSSYTVEREQELRTLTDPRVRARIDELGIELIGWRDL